MTQMNPKMFHKISRSYLYSINNYIDRKYILKTLNNKNAYVCVDFTHMYINAFKQYMATHGIPEGTKYYSKEVSMEMLKYAEDWIVRCLKPYVEYDKIILFTNLSTKGVEEVPQELADKNLFTMNDYSYIRKDLNSSFTFYDLYITKDYHNKTVEELLPTIVGQTKVHCFYGKDISDKILLSKTDLSNEFKQELLDTYNVKHRLKVCPKLCEAHRRMQDIITDANKLLRNFPSNHATFSMLCYAVYAKLPNVCTRIGVNCDMLKQSVEDDLTLEYYVHHEIPANHPVIVVSPDIDMLALFSDVKYLVWFDTKKYCTVPSTHIAHESCVCTYLFWIYAFSHAEPTDTIVTKSRTVYLYPPINLIQHALYDHKTIKIIWSWLGNDYTSELMNILDIPKLQFTVGKSAYDSLCEYMGKETRTLEKRKIKKEDIEKFNNKMILQYTSTAPTELTIYAKLWKFNMIFSITPLKLHLKYLTTKSLMKHDLETLWKYIDEHQLWRHDHFKGFNYYVNPDEENDDEDILGIVRSISSNLVQKPFKEIEVDISCDNLNKFDFEHVDDSISLYNLTPGGINISKIVFEHIMEPMLYNNTRIKYPIICKENLLHLKPNLIRKY